MGLIRKILLVIGLLGGLAAAEGLNRFGSFVSAFDGVDSSSIFTTGYWSGGLSLRITPRRNCP